MPDRHPMTPSEFDANCREFAYRCSDLAIDVHQSSGNRSVVENRKAGGNEQSKHLYGMAHDYHIVILERMRDRVHLSMIHDIATDMGFWWKPYDWGIHLQGLARGPVLKWWAEKYPVPRYIEVEE